MSPKILIFARDFNAACAYASKSNIKSEDWKFINRPQDLYGRSGWTVHKVTTWRDNPAALRINDMIDTVKRHSDLTVVEVEW